MNELNGVVMRWYEARCSGYCAWVLVVFFFPICLSFPVVICFHKSSGSSRSWLSGGRWSRVFFGGSDFCFFLFAFACMGGGA
jgi:hypothetical protein